MYGKDFTFKYTHKLFVFTNHEPIVTESSKGFWRRVRKVPFDYDVPSEKKDLKLPLKLQGEVEGILAWMVQGAVLWYKEGLEVPEIVQEATQRYKEEQDILGTFIKDFCVTGERRKVKSSVLYKTYVEWLNVEMGMKPLSQPMFKRDMADRKFTCKSAKDANYFLGLSLKRDEKQNMPEVDPTLEAPTPNGNGHTNGTVNALDTELSSIEGL